MGRLQRWICVSGVVLSIAACASATDAQDLEPAKRVQALEEKVATLEARLGELERRRAGSASDVRVSWKGGLCFDTADRAFRLRIGGRIHNDWAFMAEDSGLRAAVGDLRDGTELRRARL